MDTSSTACSSRAVCDSVVPKMQIQAGCHIRMAQPQRQRLRQISRLLLGSNSCVSESALELPDHEPWPVMLEPSPVQAGCRCDRQQQFSLGSCRGSAQAS